MSSLKGSAELCGQQQPENGKPQAAGAVRPQGGYAFLVVLTADHQNTGLLQPWRC